MQNYFQKIRINNFLSFPAITSLICSQDWCKIFCTNKSIIFFSLSFLNFMLISANFSRYVFSYVDVVSQKENPRYEKVPIRIKWFLDYPVFMYALFLECA
jgi:hypothetical protein